jgi:hypothetical protein
VKKLLAAISLAFLALGTAAIPATSATAAPHSGAHQLRVGSQAQVRQPKPIPRGIPPYCFEIYDGYWCTAYGDTTVQVELCSYAPETWYKDGTPQLNVPFDKIFNGCIYRIWLHKIDSDGTTDAQCINPGELTSPNSDIGDSPHDLQLTTNESECP